MFKTVKNNSYLNFKIKLTFNEVELNFILSYHYISLNVFGSNFVVYLFILENPNSSLIGC